MKTTFLNSFYKTESPQNKENARNRMMFAKIMFELNKHDKNPLFSNTPQMININAISKYSPIRQHNIFYRKTPFPQETNIRSKDDFEEFYEKKRFAASFYNSALSKTTVNSKKNRCGIMHSIKYPSRLNKTIAERTNSLSDNGFSEMQSIKIFVKQRPVLCQNMLSLPKTAESNIRGRNSINKKLYTTSITKIDKNYMKNLLLFQHNGNDTSPKNLSSLIYVNNPSHRHRSALFNEVRSKIGETILQNKKIIKKKEKAIIKIPNLYQTATNKFEEND